MHKGPITCILTNQSGSKVFTGGYDKAVYEWDYQSGASRLLYVHDHLVNCLALSGDGTYLASSSSDYTVKIYNTETHECVQTLIGHLDDVEGMAFADEDRLLVTTSRDDRAFVWDLSTGAVKAVFTGHHKDVVAVCVFGDRVFTTANDGRLLRWHLHSGQLLDEVGLFDCKLNAIAGHADSGMLVIGADDGRAILYRATDLSQTLVISAHEQGIKNVAFSASGRYLLTAGYDHSIRIWETSTGEQVQQLVPFTYQWERCLTFTPDETRVLGSSFGVHYCEWKLEDGSLVNPQAELATPSINDIAVAQTGEIATASDDGHFRISGMKIGRADGTLTNAVGISSDGVYAAWGDHSGHLHLVDRATGHIQPIALGSGPVNCVFYSESDAQFYVATYGGVIHVIDPVSGLEVMSWKAQHGAIKAVQVNETMIVAVYSNSSILVYDKQDLEHPRRLYGPAAIVNDVAMDDERNRIAVVSRDNFVRLYDLATGQILAQHNEHRYSIKSVSVRADGTIFSGDYWGYVCFWNPNERSVVKKRIATNGISAMRSVGDDIFAGSYDGGVYRLRSNLEVQEALRLFQQETLEVPV